MAYAFGSFADKTEALEYLQEVYAQDEHDMTFEEFLDLINDAGLEDYSITMVEAEYMVTGNASKWIELMQADDFDAEDYE